jgi:hypothetical protein
MYEYIFVYIVLSLIIIMKIIDFLSENFFPYFFHVHLNILDQVVTSECAILGTPCIEEPKKIYKNGSILVKIVCPFFYQN